jgi:K(+)-stimulated pyrophosphate-energized sodium pump
MIEEVRRQFRSDPGIMAGTSTPDYTSCVDIAVRASLRQMIAPGVLAVTVPILVGLILRWEGAAGMLMIGTTGQRPQQRRRRVGQRQEDDRSRVVARQRR